MAFFKLRSQGNEARAPAATAAPAESIEAMRRRARHRLLGAAVLVLLGVVGFPLLFDTQPRPVAVDIPIEIPDRNKVKPLLLPSAAGPESRVAAAPATSGMITEAADGSEIMPDKPRAAAVVPPPGAKADAKSEVKPEPKAEAKPEAKPEPKPDPKPEPRPERNAEAKPEAKPEVKPEAKPEPKSKSDRKADSKSDGKGETRATEARPDAKPESKAKSSADEEAARARALLEGRGGASAPAPKAAAAGDDDAGRFVVQVGAYADAQTAREARQKLEKGGPEDLHCRLPRRARASAPGCASARSPRAPRPTRRLPASRGWRCRPRCSRCSAGPAREPPWQCSTGSASQCCWCRS